MLTMIFVLLLVGAPMFLSITWLLTRKSKQQSFQEQSSPMTDEEALHAIPQQFLQNLRFNVRYTPVQTRFGSGKTYVYLEEQLCYGKVPLTDWIKHDVPVTKDYQFSPQVLRRISLLKQYDLRRVQASSKLDPTAGGS